MDAASSGFKYPAVILSWKFSAAISIFSGASLYYGCALGQCHLVPDLSILLFEAIQTIASR
jgi:hypothetical protein